MNWILVAAGGALGSVARYGVGRLAGRALGLGLPYGTFIANVSGGLIMGLLIGLLAFKGGADQERWRLLVGVGVLGGFTTFSSFSLETALMIERRQYDVAAGYVALSVVLSIAAVFAGLFIARRVFA